MELSSGNVVAAMENSPVKEVETPWSCDQQTKGNHVITLYQRGDLNPQILYADPGLDETPLMCHTGLPLPPQGVYKEHEEDLSRSVLNQVEGSPLVLQSQLRGIASRGRSLSVENT